MTQGRLTDYTGQRRGILTILTQQADRTKNGDVLWTCRCDCGKTITKSSAYLSGRAKTKSCGCLPKEKPSGKLKDRTGQRYGKLIAIKLAEPSFNGKRRRARWLCKCDCGKETIINAERLNDGTHKTRSCGCLQRSKAAASGHKRKKELAYKINQNGCHICTSHSCKSKSGKVLFRRGNYFITIAKYLYEQRHGELPYYSRITLICNNPSCINVDHMQLEPTKTTIISQRQKDTGRSQTMERIYKLTPNKRLTQLGMIKSIQLACNDYMPEGDWIHTSGPGKLTTNYCIYERGLHKNARYIVPEMDNKSFHYMKGEVNKLKNKLAQHPWQNEIRIFNEEIFRFSAQYILGTRKRKVLVIDADLCKGLGTLINNGLEDSIRQICEAQRYTKQRFFLAITHSLRNYKPTEDETKISRIINQFNGKLIYKQSYRDGTPMRTLCWDIPAE